MMNTYEAVVILTTKLSDEDKDAVKNKISDLISAQGEVISVDDWKTKKLAYEIKHETEGAYYLYTFKANPEFIAEFERVLRIDTNVLKCMVIKKEA